MCVVGEAQSLAEGAAAGLSNPARHDEGHDKAPAPGERRERF
jgi:hypothetical protein